MRENRRSDTAWGSCKVIFDELRNCEVSWERSTDFIGIDSLTKADLASSVLAI
jgi:hypothetical protein